MHHLHFDLTPEDFVSFYEHSFIRFTQHSAQWKKYRQDTNWLLGLSVAATLGVIWMLFVNRAALAGISPAAGAWLPLIVAACTAGMWWLWWKRRRAASPMGLRAQAEQSVQSPRTTHNCGTIAITLSPTGLLYKTRDEDLLQLWSGISTVQETTDHIAFIRRDERLFLVPRRSLGDASAANSILTDARRWLVDGGASDDAIIVRFLHVLDTPCPVCKHNLRGLTTPRCPECGLHLNRENLPQAFTQTELEHAPAIGG